MYKNPCRAFFPFFFRERWVFFPGVELVISELCKVPFSIISLV